jgi:hypothetical protein
VLQPMHKEQEMSAASKPKKNPNSTATSPQDRDRPPAPEGPFLQSKQWRHLTHMFDNEVPRHWQLLSCGSVTSAIVITSDHMVHAGTGWFMLGHGMMNGHDHTLISTYNGILSNTVSHIDGHFFKS